MANTFAVVGTHLNQLLDEVEPTLRALAEVAAAEPYAPGKWTRKQVLAHLLDSASNNHQRFLRAAIQGELTFPGYAQAEMVALQNPNGLPWAFILNFWLHYNRYLAHVLAQIPDSRWPVKCHIGDLPEATLGWIAEDYVEHMKHHLNQIATVRFSSRYEPET